jgi:hypothetical protein
LGCILQVSEISLERWVMFLMFGLPRGMHLPPKLAYLCYTMQ